MFSDVKLSSKVVKPVHRAFLSAVFLFALGACAQSPEDNAPTVESARELAARGRLDKAMAQLDQLANQMPEPLGVERLRGIILYQREHFDEAVAAFTKAEAQDPA